MASYAARASVPHGNKTEGVLRSALQTAAVAAILLLACLALLLTAPMNGDFWWQDAPRHALNGAFIRDLVAAHPFGDPVRWAINYYLMRPALTIMFYPPLFYGIEAIAFQLFGFTHFVAQAAVMLFVLLLACSAYKLARAFLPRWSALGAALLAIGTPETAFWGRQVMLDVPAYALIVTSTWCLVSYVKGGRPLAVYLAALFLLAAIYTKYNAGFVAPALAVGFVTGKGRTALRDRHAIIAAAMTAVGLVPALVIMLKFGARNLDSMASLPGTIPLSSLDCWLFYVAALPGQLGAMTLAVATGGLAVMFRRTAAARDRWIYALLLTWLAVGYLSFTLIALKEVRHDIMVLLPLAFAAPLFLLAISPKPLGEAAGLALGVVTLLYTLAFCPVSRVGGYRDVADYLARSVPHDGLVVYAGYRDGNLIFNLATHADRSDIAVIRVDKLLLSDPFGERRRGVKQADDDEAQIAQMLRDIGGSYFVVQPGFWSDLAVMARFQTVINGADYEKVAHFELTGNLSTQDGTKGIDILRPTYPVTAKQRRISIDMPIIGERFEGTSHQ